MCEWEDHCGEQDCEICLGNVIDPATVQAEVETMRAKLKQASSPPNALLPTEERDALALWHDMVMRGTAIGGDFVAVRVEDSNALFRALTAMRALAKPDEGVVERMAEAAHLVVNPNKPWAGVHENGKEIWRQCIRAAFAALSDNEDGV